MKKSLVKTDAILFVSKIPIQSGPISQTGMYLLIFLRQEQNGLFRIRSDPWLTFQSGYIYWTLGARMMIEH